MGSHDPRADLEAPCIPSAREARLIDQALDETPRRTLAWPSGGVIDRLCAANLHVGHWARAARRAKAQLTANEDSDLSEMREAVDRQCSLSMLALSMLPEAGSEGAA